MNGMLGQRIVSWYTRGRSRQIGIVFVILGLLGASRLVEIAILRHYDRNWESTADARTTQHLASAEQAFSGFQRATRRIAAELAVHRVVTSYLDGSVRQIGRLFEQAAKTSRDYDVGVEVYDDHGKLIVWYGRSGPPHAEEVYWALAGRMSSYVTRGPVYSQLFVVTPIRAASRILGAVLLRRTIEVNYPLSNKFINSEGLASQLSSQLGVRVEFVFGESAEPRKDGRYASALLTGIEGRKIGVVTILRPGRAEFLEGVRTTFAKFNAALLLMLLIFLSAPLIGMIGKVNSEPVRLAGVTTLIWGARYAFLWFGIPELFTTAGIFDPAFFASKFGGGLAKSIGELTLTCFALACTLAVVARSALKAPGAPCNWWRPTSFVLRLVTAVSVTFLMFWLLRGYGAVVRSAVFDSTLRYNDPRVIVPSFELGVMIFDLFILSFCLITVMAGATAFLHRLFSVEETATRLRVGPWLVVGGLFVTASALFGVFQETPLMSGSYRLLFGLALVGFTSAVLRRSTTLRDAGSLQNALVVLFLSAVALYPLLDQNVQDRDCERVELFAAEVLRPVDSWMKTIVDQALVAFQSDETIDVLLGVDSTVVERIAFVQWAKSAASREGYDCVFAIADTQGRVLGRFVIGGQTMAGAVAHLAVRPAGRTISVNQTGAGVNASKTYTGVTPIVSGPDTLAYALVVIAAGRQALFRGEAPPILRSASQENLETFYRPIAISEFHEGKLFTTNSPLVPLGLDLPGIIKSQFRDPSATSAWSELELGGKRYDMFFLRRAQGLQEAVALGIEHPDLRWHLVGAVKMMVYYAVIVGLLFPIFYAWRWLKGKKYAFTFRDRLLVALLVVALVPVIVIAVYGRSLARERFLDEIRKQLDQETASVSASIEERLPDSADTTRIILKADEVEQVSSEAGTDFNFYADNTLVASSRPELYEAGILDKRLSGMAYLNAVLLGQRFHVETENIGLYQYAVGYRPLLSESRQIRGMVSVPTLYRQDKLDEEISRTDALIFAVFGILLLAIVIVASVFASSIASPIHKLTEATKRLSKGDLDVTLRVPTTNGEIGELIRSFEAMTKDLKRSREEVVRAERELAWKEMAKQVAHEIKNPLTPMKLSLQHLRQTYKDKAPDFDRIFDDVSATIIDQIDTLGRIASEFSHFARMPRARLERCDVTAILTESMRLFEKDAGVVFEMNLEPDLPAIVADREELRRAFINVMRNGIQAMSNAGRMIITAHRVDRDIEVRIRDFGHGISSEVRAKLFQPDFSTKTDGMGLGLAIVKKTVDDLQGTIGVESVENAGTTIVIRFPIVSEVVS